MATKGLKPMGEGMYQYAGGAFGYVEPLPNTNTDLLSNDDGQGCETKITDPKFQTKSP